jgi:multiple sugar transport system substrate-binding protein
MLATMVLAFWVVAVVTAAGRTEEETSSVNDTEIVYYTFSASPNHLEELDEIVARFNEQENGVTVTVEAVGWDNYFTRLESQIAGGSPPDVFELNYENFVNYASKDVLLSLDSYLAADETFSRNDYYERAIDAFEYEGSQYGLPATFSTSVLFYNKDLFDAAGLDYPDDSWTWEDALEAALELTDRENDVWGLYSPVQFWEFYKKAEQNGGGLMGADGITIDHPRNVEALEFMVSLIDDHQVMPREQDLAGVPNEQAFLDGEIAMLVSGIWMFETFRDADFAWDIAVEPGMRRKATHYFADGLSVSSASDHPEAAWKWVNYFTSSPEMVRTRMESNWGLPVVQDLELVEAYLDQTPPENRQAVYDSLEYAIVPPVIERQNQMQDIVGQAIENVLLGNTNAADALAEADRRVRSLVE